MACIPLDGKVHTVFVRNALKHLNVAVRHLNIGHNLPLTNQLFDGLFAVLDGIGFRGAIRCILLLGEILP
ncbi:hypothetical protein SDC9_98533 [bioreactor metagenome]|uniref:Uncharacterized protein n=1 Tax=bioreactor metagenome TaxID=1076179 RepID=A0A645AF09_9ZZZZ